MIMHLEFAAGDATDPYTQQGRQNHENAVPGQRPVVNQPVKRHGDQGAGCTGRPRGKPAAKPECEKLHGATKGCGPARCLCVLGLSTHVCPLTSKVLVTRRNVKAGTALDTLSGYHLSDTGTAGRSCLRGRQAKTQLVVIAAGQLQALPVRLGTISWTELRPDWDPYEGHGINLAESSGIEMEWGVVDDYSTIKTGGSKYALGTCKYKGDSGYNTGAGTSDKDYWALGGMSLRGAVLPSGNKVGVFLYRAHFQTSTSINVNNVTPYLLDVAVTVLTPPRKISFVIEY